MSVSPQLFWGRGVESNFRRSEFLQRGDANWAVVAPRQGVNTQLGQKGDLVPHGSTTERGKIPASISEESPHTSRVQQLDPADETRPSNDARCLALGEHYLPLM